MPNPVTQFSQDHHYASGIILIAVGLVGIVGSVTGELANMLAALWVPDALYTSGGSQADSGDSGGGISVGGIANGLINTNPFLGPIKWIEGIA